MAAEKLMDFFKTCDEDWRARRSKEPGERCASEQARASKKIQ